MTINLSEERHESDCCNLAGKKQRTGGCNSGAVALSPHAIADSLSVFYTVEILEKKEEGKLICSVISDRLVIFILFFVATIKAERIYMEGSTIRLVPPSI